jgi:predicted transcriptional regulator
MILEKVISRKEYYKDILNKMVFFSLSTFEVDIIITMLNSNRLEVNTDTREHIRKVLDKDKAITNNYIKRLRNKGVLLDGDKTATYILNPTVLQIINDGWITYNYIIHDDN